MQLKYMFNIHNYVELLTDADNTREFLLRDELHMLHAAESEDTSFEMSK